MEYLFYKYEGTGNDFIVIDNRLQTFPSTDYKLVESWCNRKFGIGADGLMLLQNHDTLDFEMLYYNADGKPGSMCGNGGRCMVAFAKELGIIEDATAFMAVDGVHHAKISANMVHLAMQDVAEITPNADAFVLNTGSPHYVLFTTDIQQINVPEAGKAIRYNKEFAKEGININFVEEQADGLWVRTYERGVENETLSCGTGVTAAVLAHAFKNNMQQGHIKVTTLGGTLTVNFDQKKEGVFSNIHLQGAVNKVYTGKIAI